MKKKIYRISLADEKGQLHNVVVTTTTLALAVAAAQKSLGVTAEPHTCQYVDDVDIEA
jgi:hypothetical protein